MLHAEEANASVLARKIHAVHSLGSLRVYLETFCTAVGLNVKVDAACALREQEECAAAGWHGLGEGGDGGGARRLQLEAVEAKEVIVARASEGSINPRLQV